MTIYSRVELYLRIHKTLPKIPENVDLNGFQALFFFCIDIYIKWGLRSDESPQSWNWNILWRSGWVEPASQCAVCYSKPAGSSFHHQLLVCFCFVFSLYFVYIFVYIVSIFRHCSFVQDGKLNVFTLFSNS